MQAWSYHAGESRPTPDLARAKGESRLSHLRQDLRPEAGLGPPLEDPSGYPAVLLSGLWQNLPQEDRAGAAHINPHRQKALYLRHMRAYLRAETRTHLPQEAAPRPAAAVACSIH